MLSTLVVRWKRRVLLREWVKYRAFVLQAIDAGGIPVEREQAYLALQTRIVAGLEFVMARQRGIPEAEARQATDEIRTLLGLHRSLKVNAADRASAWEAFEKAWHRHFLFLSRLRGAPVDVGEKAPAAYVHPRRDAAPSGFARRRLVPRLHLRRWLRYLVQMGLLALAIYIVASAIGFGMTEGRFTLVQPGSFAQVVTNFMTAVNHVWAGSFGPLAASVGTLTSLLLAGLFVVLVGYWLFVRG